MSNIKVSVLVYVLNGVSYLEKCVRSVMSQTLHEIEILVIDGGSTDGTLDIVEKLAEEDQRIRIIHSASGVGLQFNTGLREAKGEYIGICESDDYILPDMYEKEYALADKHRLDFLRADYESFFEMKGKEIVLSNNVLSRSDLYNRILEPQKDNSALLIGTRGFWSGLYRREFLLEKNIFMNETPGASYQDTTFAFLTEIKAERVMVTKDSFYRYRLDNPNSSVNAPRKMMILFEEYRLLKERLIEGGIYEKYKDIYFSWKVDGCLWFYHALSGELRKKYVVQMYQELREEFFEENFSESELSKNGRLVISKVRDSLEALGEYLQQREFALCDLEGKLQRIDGEKPCIIFGCGNMGRAVSIYLTETDRKIAAYIDNAESRWGELESGVQILKPQQAVMAFPDAVYIVSNVLHYEEMKNQLLQYGVCEENLIVCNEYALFLNRILKKVGNF